jgi:hypothetical protein
LPLGIAYEGNLYVGRTKTKQSKAPISVPDQVRPVIEAWKAICPDTSPEALMFPTFGRGNGRAKQFLGGGRTSSNGGFVLSLRNSAYQTVLSPFR